MHLDPVGVLEEDRHPVPPARYLPRRRVETDLILQPLVDRGEVIDLETDVPEPEVRGLPGFSQGLLTLGEIHELDLDAAEAHHGHPVVGPLDGLQMLETDESVELD